MKLAECLKAVGFGGAPDEFVELLADNFANMYPGFTDEQLYRRPQDAGFFCDAIRHRVLLKYPNIKPLPDEVIIGTLQNARKGSRLRSSNGRKRKPKG